MTVYRKEPVTLDQVMASVGKPIGVSGWREVTQSMIDKFADATDDHQFIHVDPQRAAQTAFRSTIAHGFLSLSLLSTLAYETIPPLKGSSFGINYGFDRVRFSQPVKSGERVRAQFMLAKVKARPSGWIEIAYDVTMEVEKSFKPAFTARWLTISVMDPEPETTS